MKRKLIPYKTTKEVAFSWGMKVKKLNALLRQAGVIEYKLTGWTIAEDHQGRGYGFVAELEGGRAVPYTYIMWSPSGEILIRETVTATQLGDTKYFKCRRGG